MALTRATDKIIGDSNGNLNLSGIVTASSFVGSGSGLTGVASTDNIKTSTTANFTDGINVVGLITATSGINLVGNDSNVGSSIKLGNASGIVTATTFSGSGANLTSLPSAQLTGALPAISGASLTGVTAVGLSTTASINTTGIITATTLNYTGNQNLSHRNIIINGAMLVAQRNTDVTSATAGYHTVDRIQSENLNADEAPRRQQVDVSSSSTPYTLGFRKAYKLTNGNQTSGAGADDIMNIRYKIEGQDIATSGWNYKSASSFITLQFWIKSSVSQNFNMYLRTRDGTNQTYAFDTGTLSADTWTKITKTIPGNSSIQLDNDNGEGLQLNFGPFWGTDRTNNNVTNEVWQSFNSASRMKDNATTWYTTDNATLEMTGLQLEVGPVATPFEHRSYADELRRCQRYFFNLTGNNNFRSGVLGYANSSSEFRGVVNFPVPMRAAPTFTGSATAMVVDSADDSSSFNVSTLSIANTPTLLQAVLEASPGGMTAGQCGQLEFRANNGFMNFDADL